MSRARILKNAHHVRAKYAVVTYAGHVRIINKKFTESIAEFNHEVMQNLHKGNHAIRFMHYGIGAATQLLQRIDKNTSKIMIIVSQGRVSGTRQRSGYSLARIASIKAREEYGIKIVSTSDDMSTTDLRTLYAVASYPKELNTVVGGTLHGSVEMLAKRVLNIANGNEGKWIKSYGVVIFKKVFIIDKLFQEKQNKAYR